MTRRTKMKDATISYILHYFYLQSIPFVVLVKNKARVGEMSGPNKEKLKNLITGKL